MRRRPWGVALLVLGGVATGVAVAGVPSRGEDPPLRIDASVTSSTPTTVAPVGDSTTSTTAPPAPTSTTAAPARSRP